MWFHGWFISFADLNAVLSKSIMFRTQGAVIYATEFRLLLVVVCILVVLMAAILKSVVGKARR
jgi:hypothetical protein